jgi:hypothetical protein
MEKHPGKTRDTAKHGFKRLGEVVRDEVLKDLDGRDPRVSFVDYPRVAANAHDQLIVVHAVDEGAKRFGEDLRVSVNLHDSR